MYIYITNWKIEFKYAINIYLKFFCAQLLCASCRYMKLLL